MRLFVPATKVQKDRSVMRDTDARLAKYSRRGILLNLAAYLLCAGTGQMHLTSPRLTVVLTVGLVLLTLVRGFYAFRFEAIYPRAPSRWRDQYFIVTFMGAIWWSVIVVSFTLTLGMTNEVPLLWLYTIVFFSTISHAFAPFKTFCLYYQLVALFPPVLAAMYVGGFDAYMHAIVMLLFLTLLSYQSINISQNYWERLQANFMLKQKAKTLEEEKRTTEASMELNHEFITNLGHELRTSLNDVMGSLELIDGKELSGEQGELLQLAGKSAGRQLDLINNIMDFSRIVNHQLPLEIDTFNIREQLEHWLRDCANEAHQHGIELECQFRGDIPVRLRGDAVRLGQIINLVLNNSLHQANAATLYAEFSVERLSDQQVQLQFHLASHRVASDAVPDRSTASSAGPLWFTLCKGITECMGGEILLTSTAQAQNSECWLQIPFEWVDSEMAAVSVNPAIAGMPVLFYSRDKSQIQALEAELPGWGLQLTTSTELTALAELFARIHQPPAACRAVIYSTSGTDIHDILSHIDNFQQHYPHVPVAHILYATHREWQSAAIDELAAETGKLYLLRRPFLRQEFCDALSNILLPLQHAAPAAAAETLVPAAAGQMVMVVDDHRVNQIITEGMLKKLGYRVLLANNGVEALQLFEDASVDLILMDCQMPEMDGYEATRQLRAKEENLHLRHVPIIAMTAQTEEGNEGQCLAAGMDDYLAKPVSLLTLENHLNRWLTTSA